MTRDDKVREPARSYLNSNEHSHTHIGWLIVILYLSKSRYQQNLQQLYFNNKTN